MRENRIQTGAPGRIGIHNPVLRYMQGRGQVLFDYIHF